MKTWSVLAVGALAGCMPLLICPANAQAAATSGHPVVASVARTSAAPELFGTIAMPIMASRFSEDWERARRQSISPRMRNLVRPATNVTREQQLVYIQKEVSRMVGWRSDATQWDRHDYWASADETLSRGLGDSEDRAIVKMQALLTLGFSSRDLFLTLGRDRVAGPQAILIVRLRDRYLVLDDNGTAPFAPEKRPEFTPVFTFGFGASWAHLSHANAGTVRAVASRSR